MKARSPAQRPRGRLRRWILRVLGGAVALLAILLGAALVLVHGLDRPWVKRRVRALVLAKSGLEIDYGAVHVRALSGLDIDNLVVQSPAELRAFAPDLVRIGSVEARWSASAILGRGPVVQGVDVEGVALTVVVDEHGRTSFDAIPSPPSPPTPPTPLSRLPAELLGALPPVRRVHVGGVTLELVQTAHDREVERDAIRGLSIEVDAAPIGTGARLRLSLGEEAAPLDVDLERRPDDAAATTARARLWLAAEATPSDATLALDLRIARQDLWPGLAVEHLAHVDAGCRFDAAAGRTEITLAHVEIGDGAATAQASVELPDVAPPVVHRATGDVDVALLLRLAPAGLVPVRVGRGHLHYTVDELGLDRPTEATSMLVEGELSDVDLTLPDGSASIAAARLSLRARPRGADSLSAEGTLTLDALRVQSGEARLRGSGVTLQLDGERSGDGAVTGKAALRFTSLDVTGAGSAAVRDGRIAVSTRELRVDPGSPLQARGDLVVEGEAASIEAQAGIRASLHGLRLHAHAPLSGGPLALDAELGASRLRVVRPDGRPLADAPVRVELGLKEVSLALDHPARTTAVAHAVVEVGALRASVDATKQVDALDYAVSAEAAQLGDVRLLVPPDPARPVAWEKIGLTLRSSGRVERLATPAPEIRQRTELRLQGPAFSGLAARSMAIDLQSNGTALRHDARADVRAEALIVGGAAMGDRHLVMSVQLDRAAPSLHVELDDQGAPLVKITASLAYDRALRAVTYDVSAHVARLSPLAPMLSSVRALAGFDLSRLDLILASQGTVVGVVSGVAPGGALLLSPDPPRTAGGQGTVDLHVAELRWSQGDRAITCPAASWHGVLRADGARRAVESDLTVDALSLALGRHRLDVTGLHDKTSAAQTGDVVTGDAEITQHLSIVGVKQDFAPMYAVGDVAGTLVARRDAEGLVSLEQLRIENRAGGTTLTLSGGLDLGEDRRRLSLHGDLQQDLARASTRADRFTGRGKLALDVAVESPDLIIFRTRSTVRLEDAHVHLPRAHVDIDGIDGEVPLLADVTITSEGVDLLRDVRGNPYAMLRFADQHPLISHKGFLSIGSVTTPLLSIAPFAANLKIEQNIVSLAQLEMGVRGGRVTGNAALDWNGAASTLHADVRASDVRSSHGEPFDGNAALQISVGDRSIEGRADILRIGRRHLLDLLDLQDPHRADAAMNRIRGALAVGYPDRVRISFDHGFASAGVTFGGVARLVSVADVRGIPIGPLMERVTRSLSKTQEEP